MCRKISVLFCDAVSSSILPFTIKESMLKKFTFLAALLISSLTFGQGSTVTSWVINTTGATGYNNIPSNVQGVKYTSTDVYVSASCIPGYDIGPWTGNPNTPVNQNFVFKITRNPTQNTGTATTVGLGSVGVWSNGVVMFNAKDGMSYNNAGVWNRNAYYWEGASFDDCLGHPAPNGAYHHHVNPKCLYDDTNSSVHSPVIGYAFDGFPVYGAYAYTNTNGTGAIKRMTSSYVVTTATTRTNGPAVSATYPAGCFIEDYIYTAGAGDLDARNGRYCITPEYPNGIYAYFVTIDANLNPVYPFILGSTYYGTVQAGNTGPNGGHNTIPANAVTYTPSSGTPLISSATSTNVSCFGSTNGTITLAVSGGTAPYTYLWTGGITTQNRTGLAVGSYTATVTDATAQTAVVSATITQPTALAASATSTNAACSNTGSITLAVTGGTSPYSYSWGGGITTQNRTGLAAGTYTVTITDANACSTTLSRAITQSTSTLAASIGSIVNTTCTSSTGSMTASASGGTAPYTYLWNSGTSTASRTGLAAGTYTVTITDAAACTKSATAIISSQAPATPTGLTTTNITTTSAKFNWTAVSGAANYTVQARKVGMATWVTIGPITNNYKTVNSQIAACKTYEWKVLASCSTGASSAYSSPISFSTPCANKTDVLNNEPTTSFVLLPNPANSVVTLNYNRQTANSININVFDVTGKMVHQQSNSIDQGDNSIDLSINQLPEGYYVVQLTDGAIQIREKLLIAR